MVRNLQALEVFDRLDLVAEPAGPLRAGVAAQERLEAEAAIHFVIQRLAAAMVEPAELFICPQAERLRSEQQDTLGFRTPIGRYRVIKFGCAFGYGIEHAVAGHQFTGGIQLHFDAPAGKLP